MALLHGIKLKGCVRQLKTKVCVYMKPDAKLKEVQAVCEKEAGSDWEAVCVPQWFVSSVRELLQGSSVKAATIIGLPGGTTASPAKYAEMKQAVANGASLVILPANMDLCLAGDWNGVKQDLSGTMIAARKGAEVLALLDGTVLPTDQLVTAAQLCMQTGVRSVLVSGATKELLDRLQAAGVPAGGYGKTVPEGSATCAVLAAEE